MPLTFIHRGPIDMSSLDLLMAWCHLDYKPLSESMTVQSTDTFMCHLAVMSSKI